VGSSARPSCDTVCVSGQPETVDGGLCLVSTQIHSFWGSAAFVVGVGANVGAFLGVVRTCHVGCFTHTTQPRIRFTMMFQRVTRKQLLKAEFVVFARLDFSLFIPPFEYDAHFQRLLRVRCHGGVVGWHLHPLSLMLMWFAAENGSG